ncbi:MAG: hypothetical protein K9L26_02265 [Candidatus Izimaplasma sp.]|nr:hypothetical protein [Candidatus Izimaplasma bacterium]
MSRSIMSNYIIAIDGGGTKTLGVLYTLDGIEEKRVIHGFANFSVDELATQLNLKKTIDDLIKDVDTSNILGIVMGVAGVSKLSNKAQYIRNLEHKYHTKVIIVSDAEIALYSIKKDTDNCVIMVLGGTGSAVMLNDETGTNIIGGFGHILGDEGSGYHLAITALRKIIGQYENNQKISELSKEILKHLDITNYVKIKRFVYNNKKSEIAKLSLFISKYAIQGNDEAKRLFVFEGKHLARQTILAYKKLDTCQKVTIGIRGGFLQNAPLVKETFVNELEQNNIDFDLDESKVEPIIGAFYLAKRNFE